MKKKNKTIKLCCKEMVRAVGLEEASIRALKRDLLTLHIGIIRKTPEEATQSIVRLIRILANGPQLPAPDFKF